MKITHFLLLALMLVTFTATDAQQTVPSANDILKKAYTQARLENKNVFVIFHASWCGWCHKMDSSMNDEACKKYFADNYITCHLTVDESKDKKDLENPGAIEFRKKYNGENAGLPFWLIFDQRGKLLADSKMRADGVGLDAKGESIGCPATKEEVAYFIKLLKQTSSLRAAELAIIEERFTRNKE